jgi:hypothetical protein
VDHPPNSNTEAKKRVQLYIYSPSGFSWQVIGCPAISILKRRVVKLGMFTGVELGFHTRGIANFLGKRIFGLKRERK